MPVIVIPKSLREKLWEVESRYNKSLTNEISGLRNDMAEEDNALRVEIQTCKSELI